MKIDGKTKDIKYYMKFIVSLRSMSTSLLNLTDSFSDRVHEKMW